MDLTDQTSSTDQTDIQMLDHKLNILIDEFRDFRGYVEKRFEKQDQRFDKQDQRFESLEKNLRQEIKDECEKVRVEMKRELKHVWKAIDKNTVAIDRNHQEIQELKTQVTDIQHRDHKVVVTWSGKLMAGLVTAAVVLSILIHQLTPIHNKFS